MLKRLLKRSTAAILTITLITSSITFILSGCTNNSENTAKLNAGSVMLDTYEPTFEDTDLEMAGEQLTDSYKEFSAAVQNADISAVVQAAAALKEEAQSLSQEFDSYAAKVSKSIKSESKIIQQRQSDFEADVKEKADSTLSALDTIIKSTNVNGEDYLDAVDAVEDYFAVKKTKSLGAEMENNAIAASVPEKQEVSANFVNDSEEAVGAAAPGSASLAMSEETALSDEMKAMADQLKTPLAVYLYVKNNIRTEFYYGSRKGAVATFDAKGGNDTDQASLLIAMLRYLGYNSRYVSGNIYLTNDQALKLTCATNIESAGSILISSGKNVTAITQGGKITGVMLNQTWVEAYIPYTDYRGAGNAGGENRWIPLDPSIKEYRRVDSIYDNLDKFGVTDDMLNSLTTTYDEEKEIYQKVTKYGEEHPYETVNLNKWEVVKEELEYLPLSLPYAVKKLDREFDNAGGMADTITFSVNGETLASVKSLNMYSKRVVLEYEPATEYDASVINGSGSVFNAPSYLVKMVPTLKIDGDVVGTGDEVSLGKTESFRILVNSEGKNTVIDNEITAGSIYQITQDMQAITEKEASKSLNAINALDTTTAPEQVFTDDYIGKILDFAGKMYYMQVDAANETNSQELDVSCTRSLSVAVTGYEVTPRYMYGIPVGISEGSLSIDVDVNKMAAVSRIGNDSDVLNFMTKTGFVSSSYESGIWEAFTVIDGVSTVTAMEKAREESQEIVTLSKENFSKYSSKIHADPDTMQTISSAVQAGKLVTIHTDAVTIGNWSGFGYIIATPETGGAAYMISNDTNGGLTSFLVYGSGIIGIAINIISTFMLWQGAIAAITALACVGPVGWIAIGVIVLVTALITILAVCSVASYINNMNKYRKGNISAALDISTDLFLDSSFSLLSELLLKDILKDLAKNEAKTISKSVVDDVEQLVKNGDKATAVIKYLSELAQYCSEGLLKNITNIAAMLGAKWLLNILDIIRANNNNDSSGNNSGNNGSDGSGSGGSGSGGSGSGIRHRVDPGSRQDSRTGQRLRCGGEAPGVRKGCDRHDSRSERDFNYCR